ncbi:MAG TPA: phosphoenolpyruvate synthase regulatory protein [Methylophilaceae bacterium]|jgi:regulator of PEP synthase PpsR (kinase-PPPase family)|nr:phosphoenolpyruvate synthase regulatory protein [Methylophilaceae bacterium]HBO18279.1 phosphoenolpyruvate synthase regulatory protein [Methylophilaceae bacterium]HCB68467.1 phosphoenolpyruvate synthase regulatory protein [Methylophilaceae bacterium]HCC72456.1 phosphoenolpyruvate synthase regulatory protein [Methylophilaceae bacterium]
MAQQKRTAFFISDGTGITAGALGQLLAHFPETQFTQIRIPFTDSDAKVDDAQKRIVNAKMENGVRPIVIMSIGNPKLRAELKEVDAYYIDLFDSFIDPLGVELKEEPLTRPGVAHSMAGTNYSDRMEAINFALGHDDGMTHNGLNQANVILVGVSRSGKTPTSIYLAMQFGIKAANYPLTPEDFERKSLPPILEGYIDKIFGLTIQADRLSSLRSERRPNSTYASLENCKKEILDCENLMKRAGIPWADSTTRSVEELSAIILQKIRQPNT